MIINCPSELPKLKKNWYVFLAGPIQGAPDWQHNMPDLEGITWLSPRRESYENFNWNEQVEWETKCMRLADIILFWAPPKVENIPSRDYGMTTRTELGEYLAMGKKTIVALSPEFPGKKYLDYKANQYHAIAIVETLGKAISSLKEFIGNHKPETYFSSDTHFGSQRTLELSKRPFRTVEEMDWGLIERWNRVVMPGDTVYLLGDLGELWPFQYLNGTIHVIFGNYDRDKVNELGGEYISQLQSYGLILEGDKKLLDDYILTHEPLKAKEIQTEEPEAMFALFGHIHGRQKIKKFGLDVGVDANNFTPISKADVEFFRGAVEKGYYDQEVWS